MAKQMILLLAAMLVATCMSQSQQTTKQLPPRNGGSQNAGSGGFATFQDKPTQRQQDANGKRGIDVESDGGFRIVDETNNRTIIFRVARIEQLDAAGNKISCDGRGDLADFGVNGPNANRNNQTLSIRGNSAKAKVSGSDIKVTDDLGGGARSNPKFKQTGTMKGMQQQNEFQVGNVKVAVTVATKDDDTATTVQVGDSVSEVKNGDTKASISISGFRACGPDGSMGRNCTCGGQRVVGKTLRVYVQMEPVKTGNQARVKPSMKSSGRKRQGSATNDTEFQLDGDTGLGATIMNHAARDDGNAINVDTVTVEAKTFMEQGKSRSGFTVDLPISMNYGQNETYFYDPVMYSDDTSGSGAENVMVSLSLLCVLSIFKFFL